MIMCLGLWIISFPSAVVYLANAILCTVTSTLQYRLSLSDYVPGDDARDVILTHLGFDATLIFGNLHFRVSVVIMTEIGRSHWCAIFLLSRCPGILQLRRQLSSDTSHILVNLRFLNLVAPYDSRLDQPPERPQTIQRTELFLHFKLVVVPLRLWPHWT